MNSKRLAQIAGLSLAATLALTGCKATEQFQDAPQQGQRDVSPAEVYDMPDGFSNFASKCDRHGNRVYVAFHSDSAYAAIAVVAGDPSCAH